MHAFEAWRFQWCESLTCRGGAGVPLDLMMAHGCTCCCLMCADLTTGTMQQGFKPGCNATDQQQHQHAANEKRRHAVAHRLAVVWLQPYRSAISRQVWPELRSRWIRVCRDSVAYSRMIRGRVMSASSSAAAHVSVVMVCSGEDDPEPWRSTDQ